MWQKKTESLRKSQIQAAMNGDFDAPKLICKIDDDAFFLSVAKVPNSVKDRDGKIDGDGEEKKIIPPSTFPLHWRNRDNEAPGLRPFTVSELVNITSIKEWAR